MNADDIRLPGHALAHHFAARVVQWARERGAPETCLALVRTAAYAASRATAEGHVCVQATELDGARSMPALDVRSRLLESRVVGTAAAPANLPLVLDDGGQLYLHRYFDYERRLARRIMARAATPIGRLPEGLREHLDAVFGADARLPGDGPDWQKLAVALAMLRPLTIISGGPGTGKTTTVVNLLACLLALHPECRVRLAAPTGKAAARMLDAMRAHADRLAPGLASRLPAESFTIHRLLGVRGDGNGFRHHAGNPLPVDVLIVDEASMLDLALAVRLIESVPNDAKVILLGDKDQLASVEAGAVFAELCADPTLSDAMRERLAEATGVERGRIVTSAAISTSPVRDCVVWFTESFRFGADSGIGRLAAMINAGDGAGAMAWLRSGGDPAVTWIEDEGRSPSEPTMTRIEDGYRPYVEALRAHAAPVALFETFNRFRVLCAERQGPRGVAGLNEAIGRWFRAALDHPLDPGPRSPWYPGRPVMVMRNDYALRLYNGDVGIVQASPAGLAVMFPSQDGGYRAIPPARLPEHQTAFAITVHKAQGSEFDDVCLVLPGDDSPVLSRELAYTAVTRARTRAFVAASEAALAASIDRRNQRQHGLLDRLREAQGDVVAP